MKRSCLLLLLLFPVCAWADASSHRKAVDELMQVLRVEGQALAWRKQLDAQAVEVINKALAGKTEAQLNEGQRAAIDQFSQRANAALDAALDWSRLREPAAQIYLDTYSEAEVRDLTGFYRSATGQKFLRQEGRVAESVGRLFRSQIQATLPEFQRIGQDFSAEYERAGSGVRTVAASRAPTPIPAPASPRPAAAEGVNPKTGR